MRRNRKRPVGGSSSPLRVALVIGSALNGGAEGQLVRLAIELSQRKIDTRVLFTGGGGPLTDRLDACGIPWQLLGRTRVPPPGGRRNPATQALSALVKVGMLCRMARALTTWQPGVVFAWLPGAVWPALLLATPLTRAVRIAAFRGSVVPGDIGLYSRLFRLAVRHAHAVTVNAPSLRAEALRWGRHQTA